MKPAQEPIETINPYNIEAPGVRTANEETVRVYRSFKQAQFYGLLENEGHETIDDLKGKDIRDRFLCIRRNLFPPEEFQGIDVNPAKSSGYGEEIFTRTTNKDKDFYPRLKESREILTPSYLNVIDTAYNRILEIEDKDQRESAFKRLASVSYTLGIMIHPAPDGNGQTFKTLALSYLHEGCSDLEDSYLPLKISGEFSRPNLGLQTMFSQAFISIPVPDFYPQDEFDKDLVDANSKITDISVRRADSFKPGPGNQEYNELQEFMIRRELSEVMSDLSSKYGFDVSSWSVENLDPDNYDELSSPFEARQLIADNLLEKGYDPIIVQKCILGTVTNRGNSTHALLTLLGDSVNALKVADFIVLGQENIDIANLDYRSIFVLGTAFEQFNNLETEMINMLKQPEISSSQAILKQMETGARYYGLCNRMAELKTTDKRRFNKVWNCIREDDNAHLSQEQIMDMIENVLDDKNSEDDS